MFWKFVTIILFFLQNFTKIKIHNIFNIFKMLRKSCRNSQQIFCCISRDYKTISASFLWHYFWHRRINTNIFSSKCCGRPDQKLAHHLFLFIRHCKWSGHRIFKKHFKSKKCENEKLRETRTTFLWIFVENVDNYIFYFLKKKSKSKLENQK